MHIQLEGAESHTIQAYDQQHIQINSLIYDKNFILTRQEIMTDLPIHSLQALEEQGFALLMQYQPEILLIGNETPHRILTSSLILQCNAQRIGVECMSLGAACRTYNVLLSEGRAVVALFLFELLM